MADWRETLNEVNRLKDIVRSRSMIFDVMNKEFAAELWELPLNTFYDLSFQEWSYVSERYSEFLSCMSRDLREVEIYSNLELYTVPFSHWVPIYKEWLTWQYENQVYIEQNLEE